MILEAKPKPGCIVLLVGVAGLLLGLLLFQIAGQYIAEAEQAPQSETAAKALTFTPTPVQPRDTPSPTPTSIFAALSMRPELLAYRDNLVRAITNLTNGLQDLSDLTTTPQIGNGIWGVRVGAKVVIIRLAHEALVKIEPPAQMVEAHTNLTEATALCYSAVQNFSDGVNSLTPSNLQTATLQMDQCSTRMNEAMPVLVTAFQQ